MHCVAGVLYLCERFRDRFAGKSASLDRQIARFRIRRHSDSALNLRGMERAATEQRMSGTCFARLLQLLQLGEKKPRMRDRINSNVVAASMRRSSPKRDIDPDEAAMGRADREPSWLGDDGSVGADSGGKQRAHAQALVLLVDDSSDEDLSPGIRRRSFHRRGAYGRDAAFHVGRAAAIDAIAPNFGAEWLVHHALDADDVEMAVQHEGRRIRWTDAGDDVWPSRDAVDQLHRKSPVVENRRQGSSAITLARR